jgi:hypothetical protein
MSTCTLGVFEIESPRKAENAIRRRSKENIVGLLLFSFSLVCRDSSFVVFCTGVLYSPPLLSLSLCIILYYTIEKNTQKKQKNQLCSRARDRQRALSPFGGSMMCK